MRVLCLSIMTWFALACGWADSLALDEARLKILPSTQDDEGSGILPARLRIADWNEAYWVILDEPPIEKALALIGRSRADSSWKSLEFSPSISTGQSKHTNDAEAICRLGDEVYIFGSHFGAKKGLLDRGRQFVARFSDPETPLPAESPTHISLAIIEDDFLLHRLINDALVEQKIELIERGKQEEERYIKATREEYPDIAGQIHEADRAINIEAAGFLDSGSLLLGLRFPVSRDGHPIALHVSGIERLFEGGRPAVQRCWIIQNIGSAQAPVGFRDFYVQGGEVHAIAGNLDRRTAKKQHGAILDDHPEGAVATALHVRFKIPKDPQASAEIKSEVVRDLAPALNAEGIAADPSGRFLYLFDESRLRIQFERGSH